MNKRNLYNQYLFNFVFSNFRQNLDNVLNRSIRSAGAEPEAGNNGQYESRVAPCGGAVREDCLGADKRLLWRRVTKRDNDLLWRRISKKKMGKTEKQNTEALLKINTSVLGKLLDSAYRKRKYSLINKVRSYMRALNVSYLPNINRFDVQGDLIGSRCKYFSTFHTVTITPTDSNSVGEAGEAFGAQEKILGLVGWCQWQESANEILI